MVARHLPWCCAVFVGALLLVLIVASSAMAAGDANTASCPNEAMAGFREYLPDCSAYEMVSPPFKDGQVVDSVLAMSSDGSRVLERLVGAFGGAESSPNAAAGSVYEASRSRTGWVTSAIGPPASLFPVDNFYAASTDLGRTLWTMRRPSQSIYAQDVYVREPDGAFLKVGPMVPPAAEAGPPAGGYQVFSGNSTNYTYAGASSDLSHVLFQILAIAPLWPGDTTANDTKPSLYEYVGRENRQPALVGVSDGSTVVNGNTLPAGRLLSSCATALGLPAIGAQGADRYNAISANGETVFFTSYGRDVCGEASVAPEVSELYARLDATETVAISEPSPSQCAACNTPATQALGRRAAQFQGASEDGTKVFFLTEQELFSGDTTNNLYEYDFAGSNGKKIVRVSIGSPTPDVQGVARVSEDGSHVYFVAKGVLTEGTNAEGRAPVTGGENLYVFERDATRPGGHLAFIATLSEADNADWQVEDERPVQSTPDGRFLVFQSVADLTPGDASTEPQVFEYDALKEKLARVSIGQLGYGGGSASADVHGSLIESPGYRAFEPTTANTGLNVSSDGSQVVFDSTGALTPGTEAAAAAGAESVYEYRSVRSISNGNVYLISDGTNTLNAIATGMDASAEDVLLATADPLLVQDVDTQFDLYDARVGGGFPAPATPAGCEGEVCQGAPSVQSSFGVPGSVSVPGGANVPPPPPPLGPVVKPKAKPLTQAQKLAKARKACRAKHNKHKRQTCERQARERYGPAKAKKASHTTTTHKGGK